MKHKEVVKINLILKFEILYWLVAGLTAYFSFYLPGLLLAAFGNIYIRDWFSFARGVAVLSFIIAAASFSPEPVTAQKVAGTLGIAAALVIFFFSSLAQPQRSRNTQALVVIYSSAVLSTALIMLWSTVDLLSYAWVPAVIFLCLALYSFLVGER